MRPLFGIYVEALKVLVVKKLDVVMEFVNFLMSLEFMNCIGRYQKAAVLSYVFSSLSL